MHIYFEFEKMVNWKEPRANFEKKRARIGRMNFIVRSNSLLSQFYFYCNYTSL